MSISLHYNFYIKAWSIRHIIFLNNLEPTLVQQKLTRKLNIMHIKFTKYVHNIIRNDYESLHFMCFMATCVINKIM